MRAWAKSLTDAPPEVSAGGECDPRREGDKCVYEVLIIVSRTFLSITCRVGSIFGGCL